MDLFEYNEVLVCLAVELSAELRQAEYLTQDEEWATDEERLLATALRNEWCAVDNLLRIRGVCLI